MRIAIIGTRGIPNHYGGFEQFAEYLSRYLAENGHDITVYNSHNHPYQEREWNGVKIKHLFDPEDTLKTAGQFIYDLNCILDCRKSNYDIILQLGYTSSSIWSFLMPKKSLVLTNMDGLEWKRTKFSKPVQFFLQWAEKLAVQNSDYLIADSIGIERYLFEKYGIYSKYIAYGAHIVENASPEVLSLNGLTEYQYDMLIARLEPENSIEIILDGVASSSSARSFLVVGNHKTKYGEYLKNKFAKSSRIKFLGAIYNIDIVNSLRYFSNIYFHGHTVGGTNPSLLEAMASNAFICANRNVFNEAILGSDAEYFNDADEVRVVLETCTKWSQSSKSKLASNIQKIKSTFSWEIINAQYLDYMTACYLERYPEKEETFTIGTKQDLA